MQNFGAGDAIAQVAEGMAFAFDGLERIDLEHTKEKKKRKRRRKKKKKKRRRKEEEGD